MRGGVDISSAHFNCPRCGLTIRPRARWLTINHCPRCLARERVAVEMFTSSLPASELYSSGAEPRVSDRRRQRVSDRRDR
jgi:hypothetical protein